MARVIINRRTGPIRIRKSETDADQIWICGCGLTRTPPYCDSSHATARKESAEALVFYPENDARNPVIPIDSTQFEPTTNAKPSDLKPGDEP